MSEDGSGVHKFRHLVRARVEDETVDALACLPALILVIEGEMSYLRGGAVRESARKTEIDVAGKLDYLVRLVPHVGFVFVHPVEFGGAAYDAVRLVHLRKFKLQFGEGRDGLFHARAFSFVQPHDERAQDVVVLVHEGDRVAYGRHAHRDYAVEAERVFLLYAADSLDHVVPVHFGALLRPAAAQ